MMRGAKNSMITTSAPIRDEAALVNPYEDDEPMMLEINSKSKAKCLKKVILEKKSLEGSQLLLFK